MGRGLIGSPNDPLASVAGACAGARSVKSRNGSPSTSGFVRQVTLVSLAARSAFPPFVTASKWSTVWDALWSSARKRNGGSHASDGQLVPRIRNGDAVTLSIAWLDAAGARAFPLWYQFAAIGYGWNPPRRDSLDTSKRRRSAWYPTDAASELWLVTSALAADMDSSLKLNPRLDMADRFTDAVSVSQVRSALQGDGAQASVKLPTGVCRDDATGKTRAPELECVSPTGRRSKPRYVNGLPYCPTGYTLEAKCPPGTTPVEIDDPLTGLGKILGGYLIPIVLILAAVGLLGDGNNPRRSRRLRE